MKEISVILRRVFIKGFIAFELPRDPLIVESLRGVLSLCKTKHNDFVRVSLKPPYKKRTSGKHSQNSAIHGYCQQIANYTGDDLESIKNYCKEKAIARGYPVKRDENGDVIISRLTDKPIPLSSADINTVEAGYLIDTIIQVAAELGLTLYND